MITGYPEGTRVKWNNQAGGLSTGMIRVRKFRSETVTIDDSTYEVEVNGNSPTYVIESDGGELQVHPHTNVFLEHMNTHT